MANLKWYKNKHNGELRQFSDAWYKINTGDGKSPNINWTLATQEQIDEWLTTEIDPAETVQQEEQETGTKVVKLPAEKPAKATGGKKTATEPPVTPPAVQTEPPAPTNPATGTEPVGEAGDGEDAKDGATSK